MKPPFRKADPVNPIAIAQEIVLALGLIIAFFVKLIYYSGEAIYELFTPKPAQSVKGEIVLVSNTSLIIMCVVIILILL